MSKRELLRRWRAAGDEGAALVAAIGVVIIGMMLASIVVAQAIVVGNDSGRDRARMIQVHGAEGAVDQVYGLLEMGTPCTWPASGQHAVSSSPGETSVTATITYFDENNAELSCSSGALSGVPASAVITATADTADIAGDGVKPTRTVQARVLIHPLTEPGSGAAIYSYSNGHMTNNFTLTNGEADEDADVWIDDGNVNCNSNVTIHGRVFIANGNIQMSNSCTIMKDLRVKNGLTMHQGHIQGSAYVYNGSASMNGTQARIDGDLTVSGTATNTQGGAIAPLVGGAVTTGWSPATGIQRIPLPEVNYIPSDWGGYSTSTSFAQWLKSEAEANNAQTWVPFRTGDPCGTQISNANWSMNGNVRSPVGNTIIDARGCSNGFQAQNVNFRLRGDLVIFAKKFNFTNTVNFISDDGNEHKLWIIVPDSNPNGVAHCSSDIGNIEVNSNVNFGGPKIKTFLYTPCTASISNNIELHGQVYARDVLMQNNLKVTYRSIGIPGVDLFPDSVVEGAGYEVEVVYKREIGTPSP